MDHRKKLAKTMARQRRQHRAVQRRLAGRGCLATVVLFVLVLAVGVVALPAAVAHNDPDCSSEIVYNPYKQARAACYPIADGTRVRAGVNCFDGPPTYATSVKWGTAKPQGQSAFSGYCWSGWTMTNTTHADALP